MSAFCPCCWGIGAVFRENGQGRLFAWPCPHECPQPLQHAFVRLPRTKGLAKKGKAK